MSNEDQSRIFLLCGNARTFLECFDSCYEHLISKLFVSNTPDNTHVLLYLKCDDPGPKNQDGWRFEYPSIDTHEFRDNIDWLTKTYNVTFHVHVLESNEISDEELLSQVKRRDLYYYFLAIDCNLLRALHCHYNMERCNDIIESIQTRFDYYVYVRPDLYFSGPCKHINEYAPNKIICGEGPYPGSAEDHLALIPRRYKNDFLAGRMNLFRNNVTERFDRVELIYNKTLGDNYVVDTLGKYEIKRP